MKLLLLLVVVGTASALAPLLKTKEAVPNRYIVKLKNDADLERVLNKVEFAAALDRTIKVTHTFKHVFNGFSARLTNGLLEDIRNLDVVEYVEEDSIMKTAGVASWGLDRVDQLELPLDDAYEPIGDGAGVNVYVIDTGINQYHEDFEGRAFNDHDTVGDGHDGVDCDGHGTHCSGTVGGKDYGVAKAAHIHGIRVLDCYGSGYTSNIVAGCDWVIENATEPAVASMSLGGAASSSMDAGVEAMIDNSIQVAVAAGNGDTNACTRSPARVSKAITVGATDSNDTRAYFSNFGTCVDIFAPGVDIKSTWIGSTNATNTISGTSMATPHVAGAAAILIGKYGMLSPEQIKDELQVKSIAGEVKDAQPGSPNLLLYIGEGSGGGSVPPPPPTSTPCGATITANGTLLTSPNFPNQYDNNAICEYNIDATLPDLAVGVTFTHFDVENHATCVYDALKIYDGSSSTDPLIANLCGSGTLSPVYSSGQRMYLKFTSDNIIRGTGFSANVFFYDADTVPTNAPLPVVVTTVSPTTLPTNSAPCSTSGPITTSGTNVTSPGYPSNYGNNLDCSTQIHASDGQAIKLSFSKFSLEYHSSCNYDKLEIYDGDSSSSGTLLSSFCGSDIPPTVYSSGPSMLLVFSTDGSVTEQGYFGTVTFIDESERPTSTPPPAKGCGSKKTDPRGNITTPDYPSNYNSNVDCSTHIHSENADKNVTLTFNDFNVEDDSDCSYDYVEVHDGENENAKSLGKFCGSEKPAPVSSTGPDMFVMFHSDSTVSAYGVHASYVIE